uniref:KH domain-containing protein n=1 Tax=Panagrellus redivivus TaxID=6233 RepID=A0A7E4VMP6_PANRE
MVLLKQKKLTLKAPSVWRNAVNVMTNDVKHGLLHSFLRHHRQWETAVPQLSIIKAQLPSGFQELITKVTTSGLQTLTRATAEEELQRVLKNPTSELKDTLCKAQELMHQFLDVHLPSNSSANIALNKKGQKQARFTVPWRRGTRTLVIGTIEDCQKARTKVDKIEYITTMYFESAPSKKLRK